MKINNIFISFKTEAEINPDQIFQAQEHTDTSLQKLREILPCLWVILVLLQSSLLCWHPVAPPIQTRSPPPSLTTAVGREQRIPAALPEASDLIVL